MFPKSLDYRTFVRSRTGRRLASDVLPDISVSQNLLKLTMLGNAPSAFKARNA
nr:hypothetical protein [Nostoc sp. DedQUE02]